MPHYPNPFDFVPFTSAPILRAEEQFDALGEKFSGYLELEIKALTPVHVVGRVEGGAAEHKSFFFRQSGLPCIPASSIRGCLRAFTEALILSIQKKNIVAAMSVLERLRTMIRKGAVNAELHRLL
jgi:CRISPR/Cas system CSM-associated protein Csm3 (group 7 of RAMP superfamily)